MLVGLQHCSRRSLLELVELDLELAFWVARGFLGSVALVEAVAGKERSPYCMPIVGVVLGVGCDWVLKFRLDCSWRFSWQFGW